MRTESPGKTGKSKKRKTKESGSKVKTKNDGSKEDKKKEKQQTRDVSEPEGVQASNIKEYGKLVSASKEGTWQYGG
jgi:hypothetical protein